MVWSLVVLWAVASAGPVGYLVRSCWRRRAVLPSRSELVISAAPCLISALLIGTLAGHIWAELGLWPGIGTAGFSVLLETHAAVAMHWFIVQVWVMMFVWPVAVIVIPA